MHHTASGVGATWPTRAIPNHHHRVVGCQLQARCGVVDAHPLARWRQILPPVQIRYRTQGTHPPSWGSSVLDQLPTAMLHQLPWGASSHCRCPAPLGCAAAASRGGKGARHMRGVARGLRGQRARSGSRSAHVIAQGTASDLRQTPSITPTFLAGPTLTPNTTCATSLMCCRASGSPKGLHDTGMPQSAPLVI